MTYFYFVYFNSQKPSSHTHFGSHLKLNMTSLAYISLFLLHGIIISSLCFLEGLDYQKVVQQWPTAFCNANNNNCLWTPNNFTLHGIKISSILHLFIGEFIYFNLFLVCLVHNKIMSIKKFWSTFLIINE